MGAESSRGVSVVALTAKAEAESVDGTGGHDHQGLHNARGPDESCEYMCIQTGSHQLLTVLST